MNQAPSQSKANYEKEFDDLIGLNGPEAQKEAKRRQEVDSLLNRAGVSREDVSEMSSVEPGGPNGSAILANLDTAAESHPFDDLVSDIESPYTRLSPDIETIEESLKAASVNSSGAAAAVAGKLVPELGNVLVKRQPGSLAHAFPPAVDTLIVKAKLSPEQTEHLLKQFSDLFVLSSQMRSRIQTIEIRGPEDVESIAEAKECHKIVRDERLNAEKRKKIVKEPYLRPSQLIDGVFKIWMDEIKPLEDEAKAKAEYIENLERERKAALAADRLEKLRLFEADGGSFDLSNIDDAAFELIYQGAIAAYNTRKAEAKRLEDERLERERLAAAETQRLREENERLARERAEAVAREAEQQRIANAEREKKEEAERELARQEAARLAEERRIEAEAEAKRLAPDKDKLLAFANEVAAITVPEVAEAKAIEVANYAEGQLLELSNRIRKMVENL